jgi:hypothetical protein
MTRLPINDGMQTLSTVSHAGPTSAPTLTITAVDSQSFNFTIFPLSEPSQCVLHYNITPTRSDGHVLPDITAWATEGVGPVTVIASGYDVCADMNFTAITVSSAGTSERSAVFTYSPREFAHTCTHGELSMINNMNSQVHQHQL